MTNHLSWIEFISDIVVNSNINNCLFYGLQIQYYKNKHISGGSNLKKNFNKQHWFVSTIFVYGLNDSCIRHDWVR